MNKISSIINEASKIAKSAVKTSETHYATMNSYNDVDGKILNFIVRRTRNSFYTRNEAAKIVKALSDNGFMVRSINNDTCIAVAVPML